MADVIRTVGSVTGDEATIIDAVLWFRNSANYDRATDDVGIIRLVDDEVYAANNVQLSGFTGASSSTKYIRIEAAAGNECNGRWEGARIENASGNPGAFKVRETHTMFKGVAIRVTDTASSRECIRLDNTGVEDCLIEKCYLETNNVSQQDAIYAGAWAVGPIFIFDTVIVQGGANARAGVHAQMFSGSSVQTWHIEHCTIHVNDSEAGVGIRGANTTANVHNTMSFYSGPAVSFENDFEDEMGGVQGIFVGANNVSADGSAAAEFGVLNNNFAADLVDVDQSGNVVLVVSEDPSAPDFQILESSLGTNVALASSTAAGTRDARVDLTVDVAGNPRPATYTDRDRGAYQLVAAPAGVDASGAITALQPTVSASAGVQRDAEAAATISGASLLSSAAAQRSALAALDAPIIEPQGDAALLRNVSGDLNVPALSLLAGASIVRAAAASMTLSPIALASAAEAARGAAAALGLPAPGFAAIASPERLSSADLNVVAPELAASVGADKSAAAVLAAGPLSLAGAAGVVRSSSGALTLPSLLVSALATVERLASAVIASQPIELQAAAQRAPVATAGILLDASELSGNTSVDGAVSGAVALPATGLISFAEIARDASGDLLLSAAALAGQASLLRTAAAELDATPVDLQALSSNVITALANIETTGPALTALTLVARDASGAMANEPIALSAGARLELRASAAISEILVQLAASVVTPAQAGEFLLALVRLSQDLEAEVNVASALLGDTDLE